MPLMHQLKYSVPYSAFTPSSEMLNARTISWRIWPLLRIGSSGQTTRSPGVHRSAGHDDQADAGVGGPGYPGGLGDPGQREGLVDRKPEAPGLDQLPHLGQRV